MTAMAGKTSFEIEEKTPEDTRERILAAALRLLNAGGRDAVTTRAVAEAAGVQPPVLYRQFRDKEGMLAALAEHGFSRYLARKRHRHSPPDPIEALRRGWDQHIEFGLQHPMLYLLMYAEPREGETSGAAALAFSMLRNSMALVAAAGRLRIAEEQAVSLYHAAAVGVVLLLLNSPADARDLTISSVMRETSLAAITTSADARLPESPTLNAAITLRAALDKDAAFSHAELSLLKEWLNRIVKQESQTG
jgi:AcrR family transcriptional regulator